MCHDHREVARGTEMDKLRVLIPHWMEHNEEHAANFGRWAEAARAAGAESVARHIEEAAAQMAVCNRALAAALEAMDRRAV